MIELNHLTKTFGSKLAVDNLTVTVRPGQVTGFLGPNGAGKSTTMRMIIGLDRPDRGEIRVSGRRYASYTEPLRQVGALLDAKALHPGRSAQDHLRALAATAGIGRGRVRETLELVGLTEVAGKRARTFSQGMTQRLGMAAVLLGDPPVIILDEPINGLDPDGIHWIRGLLRRLAGEGRTVFVSSHLMSEMALTADQLIILGRGRLLADVSMADMIKSADGSIRVRTPQAERLRDVLTAQGHRIDDAAPGVMLVRGLNQDQLAELAFAHRIILHELALLQSSLEDAYLALTHDAVEYSGTSDSRRAA